MDQCVRCPSGFQCGVSGLTYPVANRGYFVSPKDPTDVHQCSMGDPAVDIIDSKTGDPAAGSSSCPGGNLTRAIGLECILNDAGTNLISAKDRKPNKECREAVGALCGKAYSGDGAQACSKCCKTNDVKPDGQLQAAAQACSLCFLLSLNHCPMMQGPFVTAVITAKHRTTLAYYVHRRVAKC